MSGYQDSDECQFFSKVGACRHGAKCVRKHTQPTSSRNIVISSAAIPNDQTRDAFIKAVFIEIALISRIREFAVAGNSSPHLRGNIYVSFNTEDDAVRVLNDINARWLNRVPVFAELGPMDNLSKILCREGSRCPRALDCNYVHLMAIEPRVFDDLFSAQAEQYQ